MKYFLTLFLVSFSFSLKAQYQVSPDYSFGTNGIVYLDDQPQIHDDWYPRIEQDSNGNIYMVGEFYLYKILPKGELDLSFGTNGYIWLQDKIWGTQVIVDQNNDVILGGYIPSKGYKSNLIKFNENGVIDSSFGTDGIFSINDGIYTYDMFRDNNKILFSYSKSPNSSFSVKSIYSDNGKIDSTFGVDGTMNSEFPNYLYDHVVFRDEDSISTYFTVNGYKILCLKYSNKGEIIFQSQNVHHLTNPQINNFGAFTVTHIDNNYFLGNGIYGLDLIKVSENGFVDDSYGDGGIKTITKKYRGYFCDSKKLNDSLNILSIAAFKDSLANPAFLILDKNGEMIPSIGDSGIYSIINNVSNYRYEATSISIINDSTFLVAGYYQTYKNEYEFNHDRYFVAKYFLTKSKAEIIEPIKTFEISNLFPNPFNTNTVVQLSVVKNSKIYFSVYDILGRRIKKWDKNYLKGSYFESLFLGNKTSGIYFLTISDGNYQKEMKKIVLLK